jgi:hypothetical protein
MPVEVPIFRVPGASDPLVESLVEPGRKTAEVHYRASGCVCTPLPMCSYTAPASRPAGDYTWEPERGWFNTFGNTMPLRVTGIPATGLSGHAGIGTILSRLAG